MNKDDKELASRIVHDVYKLVDKARADELERCVDVLEDCEVVMLREDEYDEDGSAFISLDEAISKMEAIKAE